MAKGKTPKSSSSIWITRIIEGAILLLAVAFGLTIRYAVYETAIVISSSMEPTLGINDRIVVDHRESLKGHWRRGDIVFFHPPEEWGGEEDTLAKRVIGLPGETVRIEPTRVLVDGKELPEPYIRKREPDATRDFRLKPDEYFVMGDNRDRSDDSRENGPVPNERIRGRAVFRLAPGFGKLPHPEYTF